MPIIPLLISRSGCCSALPSRRRSTIPPSPRSGASSARGRPPITALTLAGGLASTVSWPTTHILLEALGWRGTYLVYAGLLACVAAPLHAFALPRTRADPTAPAHGPAPRPRG